MERDCSHWQSDFWRVLDGDLAADDSAALSEHLRGCQACRKMLVEAVAMHRKLLEVATVKQDLAVAEPVKSAEPVEMICALPQCIPNRVAEPRRERLRPRVIVIDWRMIGAAAVVVLTLLAWAAPGGAAEGMAEIRNALNFKSFER